MTLQLIGEYPFDELPPLLIRKPLESRTFPCRCIAFRDECAHVLGIRVTRGDKVAHFGFLERKYGIRKMPLGAIPRQSVRQIVGYGSEFSLHASTHHRVHAIRAD